MKKLYICLIIVLCSMKGFAQFSEYGGTYYDYQSGQTGVIVTYNPQPNYNNIGAQMDAQMAAAAAAAASHIPVQPVIPPPVSGAGATPPKPSAPPPTPKPDPCALLKAQVANATWANQIKILEGKTNLKLEAGYAQQVNVQPFFPPLTASGNDQLDFPITANTIGFMHTHLDPYDISGSGGETDSVTPIHMFSPGDVNTFLKLVVNAQTNQRPIENVYGVMVSSSGKYEIRFTGSVSDALKVRSTIDFKGNNIEKAYKKAIDDYGNEGGLIDFIENTLKLKGIELLKIEKNNSVSKIQKGTDGKGASTPCS